MRFISKVRYLLILCLFAPSLSDASEKSLNQYIKSVYSLPVSLDPVQMNDSASLVFSELVYEGLLRLTNDYGFEGSLAKSWTTSPDGKILTFKLRNDARFHNGEAVEAQDVVFSLTRAVGPKSKVFSYYDGIVGASDFHNGRAKTVVGIRALSKDTVEIRLTKAFPPIMYVLAGATAKVLPRSIVGAQNFFEAPIGSGPFKFVSISKSKDSERLVLRRFDGHRRLTGNLDEIVLLKSDESNARSLAVAGKLHDLASWPLNGTEEVFKLGQHITSPIAHTWIIGFNSRIEPFNDVNVRRAFKRSFDVEAFRKVFYPDSEPANGYIPPGFPGSLKSPIADAAPSVMTKKEIVVAIPEGLSRGPEISTYVVNAFRAKGWNVRVETLNWETMMARYEKKSLQAFLVNMNVDYPDSEFLLKNFESKNPDNFSGLKDRELDKLLRRARSTVDRIDREKIYQKAAIRLETLAPTINLFHPRSHVWLSDCVTGFEPNLLADAYIDYARVSLKSTCQRGQLL